MDILATWCLHRQRRRKDGGETLKLLGRLEGHSVTPLDARITAHCNRVAVEDGTPNA